MCFELLCTNVLVVGKIGKVLFSTYLYFLEMRNKTFCSVCDMAGGKYFTGWQ